MLREAKNDKLGDKGGIFFVVRGRVDKGGPSEKGLKGSSEYGQEGI